MKGKIFKTLLIAGLVTTASMGLAGCGKPVEVVDYEFKNCEIEYEVGDTFSIVGMKLNLEMSDGSTKEVTVTQDMIKQMPDMSTAGNKQLVIVYDGKEYTLTIRVVTPEVSAEQQAMIAQLQDFLTRYNAQNKIGDVASKLDVDFVANYLGETAEYKNTVYDVALDEVTITDATNGGASPFYKALINGIVNSSLNVTPDEIIDTQNKLSQLNLLQTLTNTVSNLGSIDYYDYLIDQVLVESDSYYINKISTGLQQYFDITSRKGISEIDDIVTVNFMKIKDKQEIDIYAVLTELNEIVQDYSNWDETLLNSHNSMTNALNPEDKHILSNFVASYEDRLKTSRVEYNEDDEVINITEVVQYNYLANNYVTYLKNILLEIENYVLGESDSISLTTIKENLTNIIEINATLEQQGLYIGTFDVWDDYYDGASHLNYYDIRYYDVMPFEEALEIIETIESNDKAQIINYILSLPLEQIAPKVTTKTFELVTGYIYDLANNNEIDYEQLIIDLCAEYDYDAQKYFDSYNNNGTAYILTDILDNNVEAMFDKDVNSLSTEEDAIYEAVRAIALYLDEAYAEGFDAVEFVDLANTYFSANIDYENSMEQPSEIGILTLTILKEMTNTDNSWNINLSNLIDNLGLVDMIAEYTGLTENAATIISGFVTDVLTDYASADYEQLIIDICAEYDYDAEKYINRYHNNEVCYLLRDIYDQYVVASDEDSDTLKALYAKGRELCVYLDELMVNDFNVTDLIDQLHACCDAMYDQFESLGEECEIEMHISKILYNFTDTTKSLNEMIQTTVDDYKVEIKDYLSQAIAYTLQLEEGSEGYNEVKTFVTLYVNKYLTDEIVLEDMISDLADIINTYCSDEVKTTAHAISAVYLILFNQGDVDYNELLSFIELPDAIESIDYNQLVETIRSKSTYEDMLFINGVTVEHVTDDHGNLVKEVLTLKASVDLDVMISSISGSVELTLEILV